MDIPEVVFSRYGVISSNEWKLYPVVEVSVYIDDQVRLNNVGGRWPMFVASTASPP